MGFENNSSAWTLIAGPVNFAPNTPNTLTVIPINVDIVIPAGQTYAFYLTNSASISNNNRYHNGTSTGTVLATNADLTIYEGTGGAYPFGTFFDARPWEGIIHYDYPAPAYLWNTGDTVSTITVQPGSTTSYSCTASFAWLGCVVEDTTTIYVGNPSVDLGNDIAICQDDVLVLDAGNPGASYQWCDGSTTQTVSASTVGTYCVTVTDTLGCTAADTVAILQVNSLPVVSLGPDISVQNPPVTLDAGAGFSSYLWNTGDNTQTLEVNATGDYSVTVTDANGCSNSDTVTVIFTVGLPDGKSTDISVQLSPNPAGDMVHLKIDNLHTEQLVFRVTDMKGSTVETWQAGAVYGTYTQSYHIASWKAGMYILYVESNGTSLPVKLVKQ